MASSSGLSSDLAGGAETIVAPATATGGALAVLRVSGPGARRAAARVCPDLDFGTGWRAQLVELVAAAGEAIDRAVAIPYPAPRSYTGEDMVELVVHGSPAVVTAAVDALLAAGCRAARPGEFTRRAVANGKMDLVQAEGVADLVAAETAWQLRAARAQTEGALSRELGAIRETLTGILAGLEGGLDFAAQGIEIDVAAVLAGRDTALGRVAALLRRAATGERVRHGVRVAVTGIPNAGKSTLFNRLVKAERAIVSPRPGTTRDVIEAEVEIGGLRVILADTAGLRPEADAVEAEGIRRAEAAAAGAGAVIVVHPAVGANGAPPPAAPEGVPWLGVVSKTDLGPAPDGLVAAGWLPASLTSGEGWDAVEAAVAELVGGGLEATEHPLLVNRRHREALEAAAAALEGLDPRTPELAAEAVREAVAALDELIGPTTAEDVLDRVFADFCIGK